MGRNYDGGTATRGIRERIEQRACALMVELAPSARRRPRSACCGRARRRVTRARARRPRAAKREPPSGARSRAARSHPPVSRGRCSATVRCGKRLSAARCETNDTSVRRKSRMTRGAGDGEIDAVRDHSPTRRRLEPCEQPQERRLTATGDTDESGHRGPRDLGVDLVKRLDDAGLDGIELADALDEQHRLRQRAAPLPLRRGSRMLRRRRRPPQPRARAVQATQRAATRARRGVPTVCTAAVDRRAR